MNENVTVVDHPLIQHKLTLMREKETSSAVFRQLLREISTLLTYEVLRDLPITTKRINTPLEPMDAPVLAGKKLAFVSTQTELCFSARRKTFIFVQTKIKLFSNEKYLSFPFE